MPSRRSVLFRGSVCVTRPSLPGNRGGRMRWGIVRIPHRLTTAQTKQTEPTGTFRHLEQTYAGVSSFRGRVMPSEQPGAKRIDPVAKPDNLLDVEENPLRVAVSHSLHTRSRASADVFPIRRLAMVFRGFIMRSFLMVFSTVARSSLADFKVFFRRHFSSDCVPRIKIPILLQTSD